MMEKIPYACNVILLGFKILKLMIPLVKIVMKKPMKIAPYAMHSFSVFFILSQDQWGNANAL